MRKPVIKSFPARIWNGIKKFFATTWKAILYTLNLLKSAGVKFQEDYCFQRAASLAYSTFLSLVPVIILMFSVLTSLKVFSSLQDEIYGFIRSNFIPEQADQVIGYFNQFSQSIGSVNSFAVIGFLIAGVFLLITLENHLNVVWRVDKSRSFFRAFINNWTVLTLGPLLISASILVTRQFKALAAANPMADYKLISFFLSFLITLFMFTLVHSLMPNMKIKPKAAIAGGFFTAFMYELLRSVYSTYARVSPHNILFGSLAVVFIFILWIFCIWILFMFGAQIAYFIQYPSMLKTERKKTQNPFYRDLLIFLTINYHYMNRTEELDIEKLSDYYPNFIYSDIASSVKFLTDKKLIAFTDERGYVPYTAPGHVLLGDTVCALMGISDNAQIMRDPKKPSIETDIANETVRLIRKQISAKYKTDISDWIDSLKDKFDEEDEK